MNVSVSALALAFSAAFLGLPVHGQHLAMQPTIEPLPKVETVRQYVASYFSDIPIMAAISGCESQFRQFDTNGDVFRGVVNHKDVGVMQINEDYHLDTAQSLGMNIYSIDGNLAYARYLYNHEGTAPWSSSEYCWGKHAVETARSSAAPQALAAAVTVQ